MSGNASETSRREPPSTNAMAISRRGIRVAVLLHRVLAWIGGFGVIIWGLSGLLHPMMTTFGPQPVLLKPPQQPLQLEGMLEPGRILAGASISQPLAVQVVPGETQLLLQVTEQDHTARRYFDIHSGKELPDHDRLYAEYLVRHYLGLKADMDFTSRSVLQTDFDLEYPQINRQLPVWRVDLTGAVNLTAYVHTETATLAALNNDFKRYVQTAFQLLHTWNWLPDQVAWVRVGIITLFVGAIFSMAISGIVLLVKFSRKGSVPGLRGAHRLGAWCLALPMLALSSSGLYHLWLTAFDPPESFLRHALPLSPADMHLPFGDQWKELSHNLDVNRVSIVRNAEGIVLYRLQIPSAERLPSSAREVRNARFDGVTATGPALYLQASSGQPWLPGDQELAIQIASSTIQAPREVLQRAETVRRFGVEYDFRNKRLPVWRLEYGAPVNAVYFVDTANGVLVDAIERHEMPERLSFSFLHKWNFLMMLGRPTQNAVVVLIVLAAVILLGGFGLSIRWKRRTRSA